MEPPPHRIRENEAAYTSTGTLRVTSCDACVVDNVVMINDVTILQDVVSDVMRLQIHAAMRRHRVRVERLEVT